MIQMRTKLEAPCAAEQEVHHYDSVVYLLCMEITIAPQTPWMFGTVAFARRGEERKIPILGDVPVERIKGVDENEE